MTLSPLRYPGGKARLAPFIQCLIEFNNLKDGLYIEPFAGGAGVALSLLINEHVSKVIINDIDLSIYAFWFSVLYHPDELCQLIWDTPVTMEVWHEQKEVQSRNDVTLLERGFSTFFLNRTNRSGILNGGVIGGKRQNGKWKMDARFNKETLIGRIKKIAMYKDRIELYNVDAVDLIKGYQDIRSENTLIYLDPPYFVKGQGLYTNFYESDDHELLAKNVKKLKCHWIVSYDNCPETVNLYKDHRLIEYSLTYSAADRYKGREIMAFSHHLLVPKAEINTLLNLG